MNKKLFHNILLLILLAVPGVFFLVSCENDIEKINSLTSSGEYPEVSGKNVEMIYSDSGKVRIKIVAKEVKRYSNTESPYVEFPQGIYVNFYNDTLGIQGEITADYAIYYNEKKLWEARGNVIGRNFENGDRLSSEEVFWDENKKLIYSNIFTKIENENNTFFGQNGFEADERLTRWKLKGSRGTVKLKDEQIAK